MNDDIRKLWIESLLGGKYAQCRLTLRYKDTFDVMGVLCDLHFLRGLGHWSYQGHYIYIAGGIGGEVLAPPAVAQWAGLSSAAPMTPLGKNLLELNDEGRDFAALAEMIQNQI